MKSRKNESGRAWVGAVSFIGTAVAFVVAYTASVGHAPDIAVCAKASIVVWIASSIVSAIIKTAIGDKGDKE